MNSGLKAWEIRFADVERFFLAGKMIGIRYNKDREIQKMEEASMLGRIIRRFNQRIGDAQEHLYVSNMTMKPQELCDLLNKRVKKRMAEAKGQRANKTNGRQWNIVPKFLP